MASVFKQEGRSKYRISYVNEHGKRATAPGFRDKQASLAKAKELERNAERTRAGLPVAQLSNRELPLVDLESQYTKEMELAGLSHVHVRETRRLLRYTRKDRGWTVLGDVRPDQLVQMMHKMKEAGRGPRTINGYRDAVRTFMEWCVDKLLLAENPITRVKKAKSKGQKTRPRRAYTMKEFRRLLRRAGAHRTVCQVAGLSGLRRNELRLLERRDFTPHGDRPCWHLRPEIVKGRRLDKVPILPDLQPLLRRLWDAAELPTTRIFPTMPFPDELTAIQKRAKVPHVDAEGRYADFHSFRYFFCTQMGRLLPIQKVKVLMRHKNIRETADLYTDLGLEDVGEDVWSLPRLMPDRKKARSRWRSRGSASSEEE